MSESLLDRRTRLGASRAVVAESAGLTVAKVWRVETDGKKTTDDERNAYAAALDRIEAGEVQAAKPRGRKRKNTEEGDEGSADADPSAVRGQYARRDDSTYKSVGPSVSSIGGTTYTTPFDHPCGVTLHVGDRVKVKGKQGTYQFRRHALHRDTGNEWLDLWGGRAGYEAIRAYRIDQVRPARKRARTR